METNALALVHAQAEDEGLWFLAETATEEYLQAALRRLHAAVEAEGADPEYTHDDRQPKGPK